MAIVTTSEKEKYLEDGVIFLRNFLGPDEVKATQDRVQYYVDNIIPNIPENERVYEDEGIALRNMFHMHLYDEYFNKFGNMAKLKEAVFELEGWACELHYVESFMKPKNVGSEVPMHQDEVFLSIARPQFVTAWFPMDPVDTRNGTLRFILGSHKWGAIPHETTTIPGSQYVTANADALKQLPSLAAELMPGDIALFGCRLLHYSLPNTSDRPRRILGVGLHGPDAGVLQREEDWERILESMTLDEMRPKGAEDCPERKP